jgi:hypothetical protein
MASKTKSASTAAASKVANDIAPGSKAPRSSAPKSERMGPFRSSVSRLIELGRSAERVGWREQGAATKALPAVTELDGFLAALDATARGKLDILIRAGREARDIAETEAPATTTPTARDLLLEPESLDELQRGLAIAQATQFDVELGLQHWASRNGSKREIEDRVWLRFGQELARSSAAEWACLVATGAGDTLDKVYMRRGDGAWWSFGALLERPAKSEIARLKGKPPKGQRKLASLPLAAIVPRRCRADRRALHRAASAVSLCFGSAGAAK